MGIELNKNARNLIPIADRIREGTAAAVIDVSFKPQCGTSAFNLLDLALGIQLMGTNHHISGPKT
jgi:hypothetical protein